MRILVEGYHYDKQAVQDAGLSGGVLERYRRLKDGKIVYNFVGHTYCGAPINDYVFFLPKAILTVDQQVFGCSPDEIIHIDERNENMMPAERRRFVSEFSIWIYRALAIYKKDNPDSDIIETDEDLASMKTGRLHVADTWLDVILELIRFYRENENFVTYVTKNLHSGYNRISWTRTVNHSQPILQDGKPIYMNPVNRRKSVNYDEELFVIFYSILNYVQEYFGFPVTLKLQFPLIRGNEFQLYLKGHGCVRLRQIKYKYFSDKALRLWHLCYAFFEKAHKTNVHSQQEDFLLAHDFDRVFEAMIDRLIGDPVPDPLKNQRDGKIVDHLYTYTGLLYPGMEQQEAVRNMYYIGDSKYYPIGHKVGDTSEYKQFTYARNVIQWNLDIFQTEESKRKSNDYTRDADRAPLRDEVTEGYNVVPNFFISAVIDDSLRFTESHLEAKESRFHSRQFQNRLFDRDTLLLTHYDVNFLYVLSLYARNNRGSQLTWQATVREEFRRKIQETLQAEYNFQVITPKGSPEDGERYIREHYQEFLGKLYRPNAEDYPNVYILATEKEDVDVVRRLLPKDYYMQPEEYVQHIQVANQQLKPLVEKAFVVSNEPFDLKQGIIPADVKQYALQNASLAPAPMDINSKCILTCSVRKSDANYDDFREHKAKKYIMEVLPAGNLLNAKYLMPMVGGEIDGIYKITGLDVEDGKLCLKLHNYQAIGDHWTQVYQNMRHGELISYNYMMSKLYIL